MTVSDSKSSQPTSARKPKVSTQVSAAQKPTLTRVGVKEFRDKATQLLAQDAPFAVERHGKVIGFYTPLALKNPERARETLEQYEQTMNGVARQMALSRDELDELLWGDDV